MCKSSEIFFSKKKKDLLKWDLIVRMVKLKGPELNLGWVYNWTVLNVTFSNTIFVIGLSQTWNWKLCVVIVYPGE